MMQTNFILWISTKNITRFQRYAEDKDKNYVQPFSQNYVQILKCPTFTKTLLLDLGT